jgi:hypothetical protein
MKRLTWAEWLLICAVVLHALWPVLWGEQTLLRVHDFLDAYHPILYRLTHDAAAFSGPAVAFEPMLSGTVLRGSLPSDASLIFWVYRLAPTPMAAIQMLHLITVLVAAASAWLLLNDVLPRSEGLHWALPLAAVFAFVPFYPPYLFGIAAMPAVAWALWMMYRGSLSLWAWTIVVLYPLCGPIQFTTLFVVLVGGLAWVVVSIRRRRIHWSLALAVTLLGVVALISEWRLVSTLFSGNLADSHRTEFAGGYSTLNIKGLLLEVLLRFFLFESNTYDRLAVGALGVVGICWLVILRVRGSAEERNWSAAGLGIASATLLCAGLEPVLNWGGMSRLLDAYYELPLTRSLDVSRFYTLVPLGWLLVLAISGSLATARLLRSSNHHLRQLASVLPILTVLVYFAQDWSSYQPFLRYYSARFTQSESEANQAVRRETPGFCTYAQYTTPELWQQVLRQIPEPLGAVRVGSVGLSPGIALLYGLNTVDGYWNVIPLEYKRRFRNVIAGELARDSSLCRYYDDWGSRMYLFSADLFKPEVRRGMYTPGYGPEHLSMALNTEALRNLSPPQLITYLVSAQSIDNADSLRLQLVSVLHHSDYVQRFHLYRLSLAPAAR